MNRVTLSGENGFWARVRTALLGPAGSAEPAYGKAEIAQRPTRKSRPALIIENALRNAWARAAEHKVSLCVMTIEMDVYANYFAAYGRDAVEDSLATLEQLIRAQLPNNKTCLRNGKAGFVIVLPDTAHTAARDIAAKIAGDVRRLALVNKESHAGLITLSMGLAIANPQGEFDRSILDAAGQAVRRAQRRGLARLEVMDLRSPEDRKRAA